MTFGWNILPDCELRGLQPQALLIMWAMAEVFKEQGFECYFTSGVRKVDVDSLHGYGLAIDCDTRGDLSESTWARLKTEVQRWLGGRSGQFDIVVHSGRSGRMHMHGEFDPDGLGVAPYLKEEVAT